jgi:hypothetical protein
MKKFFSDIINQVWTLLGMGAAWLVLDGTPQVIVGWGIVVTMFIWVITFPLRNSDD